jgi:hypothetical protein
LFLQEQIKDIIIPKSVIPTQRRVTEQLTKNWAPFKVLRQRYGTRFEEQRQLHLPQKHKATVADSTLRVEMRVGGGGGYAGKKADWIGLGSRVLIGV